MPDGTVVKPHAWSHGGGGGAGRAIWTPLSGSDSPGVKITLLDWMYSTLLKRTSTQMTDGAISAKSWKIPISSSLSIFGGDLRKRK